MSFLPLPFITYIITLNDLIVWMTIFSELNYESARRMELFCLIYHYPPSPWHKVPTQETVEWVTEWINQRLPSGSTPGSDHRIGKGKISLNHFFSSENKKKIFFFKYKCKLLWALKYCILFGENTSYLSSEMYQTGFLWRQRESVLSPSGLDLLSSCHQTVPPHLPLLQGPQSCKCSTSGRAACRYWCI